MKSKLMKSQDVINEAAAEWVVKLGKEKLSGEDIFAFEEWLQQGVLHQEAFERLSKHWLNADKLSGIESGSQSKNTAVEASGGRVRFAQYAMAALVMLVIGLVVFQDGWLIEDGYYIENQVYSTSVGGSKSIDLPDGSRITLNTASSISINYTEHARVVTLSKGEAHFVVAKDTSRPFRVFVNDKLIEAVGTAFLVRAVNDVEVTVTEGRVKLVVFKPDAAVEDLDEIDKEKPIALVDKGRQAVFQESRIVVEEVSDKEIDKQLSWERGMLTFDGEALEEVINEFARYTNKKIVILDDVIRHKQIVGYFNIEDAEKFVQALQASFEISSRVADDDTIQLYLEPSEG